jgi:hypothetical protein
MFSRALKSAIPASARAFSSAKAPLRVVITGPAGAIGYAMLFRIASGEMLGKDQPIELRLLELPVSFSDHTSSQICNRRLSAFGDVLSGRHESPRRVRHGVGRLRFPSSH